MTFEAIQAAIPHRAPFLLLDTIEQQTEFRIVCRKTFRDDEFWYAGHYPDHPLTPGVLLCEAALQAGAVLLSGIAAVAPGAIPVATRMNNVQFKRMVHPGDTIDIEVHLVEQLSNAYFMRARVTGPSGLAARLEFACTLTEPTDAR